MDGIAILFNRQNSFTKVCVVCFSALIVLFGMTMVITKATGATQWLYFFISFFSVWVVFHYAGGGNAVVEVLGAIVAAIVSIIWFIQPNWLVINIVGACIVVQLLLGLPRISLKNLILICIGYLMYDFIAVYLLNTMEEVAVVAVENSLPLLIMIPDTLLRTTNNMLFALGLGDIALPAILIREEWWRSKEHDFPKIFGLPLMPLVLLVGYIIGFICVMLVANIFRCGQPALVFIIPSMLLCLGIAYFVVGRQKCSMK